MSSQDKHSIQPILTDLEFIQALSSYSRMAQSAMLLLIVTEIQPEEAIYLKWSDIKMMRLNKEAVRLLNSLPRQLFNDLVFWEPLGDDIIPLLNLADDFDSLIGEYSLTQYRKMYKEMLFVAESSKQFMREVSEQIFWRT